MEATALVAALVDKSMLTAEPGDSVTRLRLLETLREYGAERLATHGEAAALARAHAEVYMRLAECADTDVRGPSEARGVALLDLEMDNLRAAHRWTLDHDQADLALRLSAALHFYAVHRLRDEVLGWAGLAAALPAAAGHPLQATAYASASFGAAHRGERAAALELAERGLAAATDGSTRADALESLAVVAIYEGRLRFAAADSRGRAMADDDVVAYIQRSSTSCWPTGPGERLPVSGADLAARAAVSQQVVDQAGDQPASIEAVREVLVGQDIEAPRAGS